MAAADHAQSYDVIVVGAGYGGVTCAALLVARNRRVLLVDKNAQPGGKAMTMRSRGFGYELWPIAGGPTDPSRFRDLLVALGAEDEVRLIPLTPQADGGRAAAAAQDASPEEAAGMAGLLGAITSISNDELEELHEVDALSWIRRFGAGPRLEAGLLAQLNLIFVVAVDRLPASEAIRTLRDFFNGGAGRYHSGGFASVAEVAVRYVSEHGGTYLARTRVDRVLVQDGRVTGIETKAGTFHAPVVVSNAGIQPTVLALVGPDAFPPAYVERVKQLEPSWAFVGVRYLLDAPIVREQLVLQYTEESWWDTERFRRAERGEWPENPLLFVVTPSLYDPSLAPSGQQLVLAGTMGSPDPLSPMNQAAIEHVERAMLRTWPMIADHIVRREPYTAQDVSAVSRDPVLPGQGGECIGLAQVIGQCGPTKPDVRSPLRGLYFVGCDAGGYGCGTHQAVESGFCVADVVDADIEAALARQPG